MGKEPSATVEEKDIASRRADEVHYATLIHCTCVFTCTCIHMYMCMCMYIHNVLNVFVFVFEAQ